MSQRRLGHPESRAMRSTIYPQGYRRDRAHGHPRTGVGSDRRAATASPAPRRGGTARSTGGVRTPPRTPRPRATWQGITRRVSGSERRTALPLIPHRVYGWPWKSRPRSRRSATCVAPPSARGAARRLGADVDATPTRSCPGSRRTSGAPAADALHLPLTECTGKKNPCAVQPTDASVEFPPVSDAAPAARSAWGISRALYELIGEPALLTSSF